MDEVTYRGRETETKALGKTWRFSRFDLNTWDDYLAWARKQLPDPLVIAETAILRLMRDSRRVRDKTGLPVNHLEYLDQVEAEFLLGANAELQERTQRLAMDKACLYLTLGSPEFQSLVSSPRGAARMMLLLLRKHHPEVDEDGALELVQAIPQAEQERIIAVTQGRAAPSVPLGNGPAPATA